MVKKEYLKIENIIQVKQPMDTYLIGIVKASELLQITHPNPRKYNEELYEYTGIQREIIDEKINQLKKFIKTSDATFPNTIIGTLNPNKFIYDEENNLLKIEKDKHSFAVIDGQHRLASFKGEGQLSENFDLIVTFFLGLDLEEQAYLFSIINMTQRKLNPSLVQDLTELFTITTPEKFTHNLAKIFNNEKESPWYHKIKMLGKDISIYKGTLSQYSFTTGILNLIYDKKKYYPIRNILKISDNQREKLNEIKMDNDKFVFWDLYVNEKDPLIYEIFLAYFNAIKKTFPDEWGNKDFVLTKTTGYYAFMRLLRDLYKIARIKNIETKQEFYESYLESITDDIKELNSENYESGIKGETKLYRDLIKNIKNY